MTVCTRCGMEIEEGFDVYYGEYQYCSQDCLYNLLTPEEAEIMAEEGTLAWIEFEEE